MTSDSAKQLLTRLEGFCAAMGDRLEALNPSLRARIDESITALSPPRKVAIVGLADARHHELASFLVGTDLISSDTNTGSCPVIRVRHGTTEKTHAHFEDGIRTLPGRVTRSAIATGTAHRVDLELATPITAEMNFIIPPTFDSAANSTVDLFDSLKEADLLIWCSNVARPWHPREEKLWHTLPRALQRHSILALTTTASLDSQIVQNGIHEHRTSLAGAFHAIVPISVIKAIEAAPGGQVGDPAAFSQSGASEMLRDLMTVHAFCTKRAYDRACAVRRELENMPLNSIQAPAAPLPPVNSNPFDELPSATTAASTAVRQFLSSNVATCIDAAAKSVDDDYTDMFGKMDDLLAGLHGHARRELDDTPDAAVIRDEIAEARDLVGLLQYEMDKQAAHDAVTVVRQVSIDFWNCLQSCVDHGPQAPGRPARSHPAGKPAQTERLADPV